MLTKVQTPKRMDQHRHKLNTTSHHSDRDGIKVKIFNVDTGKYLEQKVFKYVSKTRNQNTNESNKGVSTSFNPSSMNSSDRSITDVDIIMMDNTFHLWIERQKTHC